MHAPRVFAWGIAALLAASAEAAELSRFMREGIPGSQFITRYDTAARAKALQAQFHLAAMPKLGPAISLTPNAPQAANNEAHLSFWKPSFLIGTPDGGEAGINFWGIHNQGHVNVGFVAHATSYALDCRLVASRVAYKVYAGNGASPKDEGEAATVAGHLVLIVPTTPDQEISVELWPWPADAPFGFLGCELAEIN